MPTQFLPNLCRLPIILAVLLVTELMVIVYVFSLSPLAYFDWERLSLLSLYAQWIALLSVSGLCQLRSQLNRFPADVAALLSFALIMLVALLTNIGAQWIYGGANQGHLSFAWMFRDLTIIAVLTGVGLRYMYVQRGWHAEQKATQIAKLDALHARIRPHFLFNSMNTIASLISYAPADAEKAVEDLAAMFRASLSHNDVLVPWQQEVDICSAYLRIEQQRLGPRLVVDWQLAQLPDNFCLPPLSLQPLIENAIYHGIESHPDGGTLLISSKPVTSATGVSSIAISVENPCAAKLNPHNDLGLEAKNHNGMALDNIRARLAAIFKDANGQALADLTLQQTESRFIATMTLPCERLKGDAND